MPDTFSFGSPGYTPPATGQVVSYDPSQNRYVSPTIPAPTPIPTTPTPSPSVITPQAAQTRINDIKTQVDQISSAINQKNQAAVAPTTTTPTYEQGLKDYFTKIGRPELAGTPTTPTGNLIDTSSAQYLSVPGTPYGADPTKSLDYQQGNLIRINPESPPPSLDTTKTYYIQNQDGTYSFFKPTAPTTTTSPYGSDLLARASQYQAQTADLQTQSEKAFASLTDMFNKFLSGTIPLTPAQQGIVDATKSQFDLLRAQQQKANDAYTQGVKVFEARTGETTGGTLTALGNVQNAINIGIQKIAEIDQKASMTLAQLQESFQSDNWKNIETYYNSWVSFMNAKEKQLKDNYDVTTNAIKDIRDFTQKQTQQNIDNLFKQADLELSQGKFDWQKSMDEIKKQVDLGNLDVAERKQALSEAQFNLQKKVLENLSSNRPTTLSGGLPDPSAQQKYLSQFPPIIQEKIKGIADYSIDPKSITTSARQALGGYTQSDLIAAAKIYDQTYDEKQYAARQKFLNNWTAGGQNSVTVAANTAIQHLAELKAQADTLGNLNRGTLGPFTSKYNTVQQWLSESSGNSAVSKYKQTALALAGELSKIYKNSINSSAAPTDEEIKYQLGVITTGLSPEQYNGVIENGVKLMTDRLISAKENYETVMGKSPTDILNPTSRARIQEMQQKGLSIDVSGLDPYSSVSNQDLIGSLGGASSSTQDNSTLLNMWMNLLQPTQ